MFTKRSSNRLIKLRNKSGKDAEDYAEIAKLEKAMDLELMHRMSRLKKKTKRKK